LRLPTNQAPLGTLSDFECAERLAGSLPFAMAGPAATSAFCDVNSNNHRQMQRDVFPVPACFRELACAKPSISASTMRMPSHCGDRLRRNQWALAAATERDRVPAVHIDQPPRPARPTTSLREQDR